MSRSVSDTKLSSGNRKKASFSIFHKLITNNKQRKMFKYMMVVMALALVSAASAFDETVFCEARCNKLYSYNVAMCKSTFKNTSAEEHKACLVDADESKKQCYNACY
jgi:hypothetical protein